MNEGSKFGLVARRFLGIVPRQQKSQTLRPKVKAVGHVNDHGHCVRDAVERLGRNQHAPQRLHGKIDSSESCDLALPMGRRR